MGPVDKDSLAKVLGTYEVISKSDKDQRGNFEVKKTFFEFFQSVQTSFLQVKFILNARKWTNTTKLKKKNWKR